jgi:hypothetical protein
MNESAGTFTQCPTPNDQSTCNCNWQAGEWMRDYQTITTPSDGSLALQECSNSSGYYLSQYWDNSEKTSVASLSVQVIDSEGRWLNKRNTAFDPAITTQYIEAAFPFCKTSKWCWMKEQIKGYASHTDIPEYESWMKRNLVDFYLREHADDAQKRADSAKPHDSMPITLSLSVFSNASNSTANGNFLVYNNNAYFSHLQQPNPNYNKVFDLESFNYKYSNYDPFCDDINNDGRCSFDPTAALSARDQFFSDIWQFDPSSALYSPVDGLTGYTYDLNKTLFPAEPSDWNNNNWWQTYVNQVMQKIGGSGGLACSNDRSIRLTWNDMRFWEDSTWRTAKEDACGSASAYFVVRNIVPNDNTYMIERPDYIQNLMRVTFGTLEKRAVPTDKKMFDLVQGIAALMLAMDVPSTKVNSDGSYEPEYLVIDGKTYRDSYMGYRPLNFNGSLDGLVDMLIAIGND